MQHSPYQTSFNFYLIQSARYNQRHNLTMQSSVGGLVSGVIFGSGLTISGVVPSCSHLTTTYDLAVGMERVSVKSRLSVPRA